MNVQQKREPKLTVSQEFSVLQPGRQNAYLIAEADWKRIKRFVQDIVPHTQVYRIVASLCAGIFVSSLSALLTLKLSHSSPPGWAWTLVICTLVFSFAMTGAFLYFDWQQKGAAGRSVKSVLEEMKEVEQNRAPASLPSSPGEKAELVIHSAIYGAGVGHQRDVADLLRARIKDGQLSVPVTNEELGGDPAVDVVKTLAVTYSHGGGQPRQTTVREYGLLSIPEA